MILSGWRWGVCAQRLSFINQVISFKSLSGDPGDGTPSCGGKLDAPLNSPTTVITVVIMLDYSLSQGGLPHIHHAVGRILASISLL